MIKDIILSLLPVIASVGSVVGVALGYLTKFKSLVKDKDETIAYQKKVIKSNQEKIDSIQKSSKEEIDTLKTFVKKEITSLYETKKEIEKLREQNTKIVELIDSNTVIRNQLKALLEKK